MLNIDKKTIAVDNTRFIFRTQFQGDPALDRFGDTRRKCNLLIPDPEQAKDLMKMGFRVRETKPRRDQDPEEFRPEYYVLAILKYRTKNNEKVKYPPKVYLVSGRNEPRLLEEEEVGLIDNMRVKNVNVILNPYVYNPDEDGVSLYIRTMYVEQDLDDDPYAAIYRNRMDEEEPF